MLGRRAKTVDNCFHEAATAQSKESAEPSARAAFARRGDRRGLCDGGGLCLHLLFEVQIPLPQPKKKAVSQLLFFFGCYPSRQDWYIISPFGGCISSVHRTAYHHALACLFCRLDDIQCFALVIYKDSVFDDIHSFAVMRVREVQIPLPQPKIDKVRYNLIDFDLWKQVYPTTTSGGGGGERCDCRFFKFLCVDFR